MSPDDRTLATEEAICTASAANQVDPSARLDLAKQIVSLPSGRIVDLFRLLFHSSEIRY